jgi:hypothetical protein
MLDTNIMILTEVGGPGGVAGSDGDQRHHAHGLPLLTTSPRDFAGLEGMLTLVPVQRPQVPRER